MQAAIAEALTLRATKPKATILPYYDFEFRGDALKLQTTEEQEVMLAGPGETGKTLAALNKCHRLALQYPGLRGSIMRKTRESMTGTVLETFEGKVLTDGSGVRVYGGETPKWYDYPNKSRIYVGGIDKPSRALSAERDFIYVNQAEELDENEWEILLTRCTGRAGHMPYGILFGDCNPSGAHHWIKLRSRDGKLLFLESKHEDNPRLFDAKGNITPAGVRSLAALDRLTGARLERLRYGKWVSPEGLVYSEFNDANIVGGEAANSRKLDFDASLPLELAMDDGYIDPRVVLFIQRTPEYILVFDEMWHTKHLAQVCVSEVVDRCKELYGVNRFDKTHDKLLADNEKAPEGAEIEDVPKQLPELAIIPPESIELRTRLRKADIRARSESSKITQGIEVVRRLIEDADGVRSLLVHRRCTNLIRELTEGYKYPPESQSRSTRTTHRTEDQPIDAENHGADAFRYWAWLRAKNS